MLAKDFRLRVFYEAARHESFTKAGEVLFLTQPAVSFQIKSLEAEIGARLFRREKNRMLLTGVGEIVFRYARDILALYDRAEAEIARLIQHVGGKLLVGVTNVIAKYVLPRPIGAFKKLNPQVSIVLQTGNTDSIVEDLLRGELDLAIVSDPLDVKDCVVEPWIREDLLLIVPSDHRWSGRRAIALEDLAREPFIMREEGSGTRRMLELYLEKKGLAFGDLNVVLTLGSTEAVKAGVEAGAGVSVISSLSLRSELETGSIRTVAIEGLEMSRTFNLVYPKLTYRKLVVETFLDFCRAVPRRA
jgi:DNA-binding transcriptional LysR family regulator